MRQMTIQVRYECEIERDAELLLAEFEKTTGAPIKLPVPVADITTYHLALRVGFADLHQTLGIPVLCGKSDILGAIWVDTETPGRDLVRMDIGLFGQFGQRLLALDSGQSTRRGVENDPRRLSPCKLYQGPVGPVGSHGLPISAPQQ
jgi:hypothetical protein